MPSVSRIVWKEYAGPKVVGTTPYTLLNPQSHMERAFYVTSMVESGGLFGTCIAYDGTAMTAGLHQAIAVYPKELASEDFNAADDQGSLIELLRLMEFVQDFPERDELFRAFMDNKWYVAKDGKLRYSAPKQVIVKGKTLNAKPGEIVYGADIRNTFTPMEGQVPPQGPLWEQSKKWALLFHKVFSAPVSFPVQIKFGMDHMVQFARRKTLVNGRTILDHIYNGDMDSPIPVELDMAMTVFWCNVVNAPAIAMQCMDRSVRVPSSSNKQNLGATLLRSLGTSSFGKWDDDIPGGRYQRTRYTMKRIAEAYNYSFWPDTMFSSVMPKDFPD